jgi:hypothetical protein
MQAQVQLLASLAAFPANRTPLPPEGIAEAAQLLLWHLQTASDGHSQQTSAPGNNSSAALDGLSAMAGVHCPVKLPAIQQQGNYVAACENCTRTQVSGSLSLDCMSHCPAGAGHAAQLQQTVVPSLLQHLAPLAAASQSSPAAEQQAAISLTALPALARSSAEMRPAILSAFRSQHVHCPRHGTEDTAV